MSIRKPIILGFQGISNGRKTAYFGKLVYSLGLDLSFENYSRVKTFKSIVALYTARPVRSMHFLLRFDHGNISGKTDVSGSFWCEVDFDLRQTQLKQIQLEGGEIIHITDGSYHNSIHTITAQKILISDLDDTLIDSFVNSKLKQLRSLLFTTVENRKVVKQTAAFVRQQAQSGVATLYLSNSEQNLYPMLSRFLAINNFPPGALMLRQFVHLRNWLWSKISRRTNTHKRTMLEKIIELFPDRQYMLLGDNTQRDLTIYLNVARQHPRSIQCVIIRQATLKKSNEALVTEAADFFQKNNITFFYGTELPGDLLPALASTQL